MSLLRLNSSQEFSERFDLQRFIRFDEDAYMFDVYDSQFLVELKSIPSAGRFEVLTEVFAPDLISFLCYNGDHSLWAIILFYNGFYGFDALVRNTILEYPSMPELEKLFYRLSVPDRQAVRVVKF